MNQEHIIQMAIGIREVALRVSVSGAENWQSMLNICRTADAIIEEASKDHPDTSEKE